MAGVRSPSLEKGGEHSPFLSAGAVVLGPEVVETANIKANAITSAKIANEAVETTDIKAEAVTAPKLAKESVENEKIKNESVTNGKIAFNALIPSKVKPDEKPVPSAEENKVVVGAAAGIGRKIVAAITGNAIETKFKIKHNLETQTAMVTFLTATFEEPVTMLAKSVAISLSEVEVTFTVAPGAKVVNYVVIVG
jgi:hypothetical protein